MIYSVNESNISNTGKSNFFLYYNYLTAVQMYIIQYFTILNIILIILKFQTNLSALEIRTFMMYSKTIKTKNVNLAKPQVNSNYNSTYFLFLSF